MKKILFSVIFLSSVYFISNHFNSDSSISTIDADKLQQTMNAHQKSQGLQINPNDQLRTLDGNVVKLSNFEGKPLVVMFWATWCKACKMQLPEMIKMQQQSPDVQFAYIAVNSKEEEINKVIKSFNGEMPVYFKGWKSGESVLSGNTLPLTYVIDQSGIILEERLGYSTTEGISFISNSLGKAKQTASL